jgi:hypothetical protein
MDLIMNSKQFTESTTSGAIATVATPVGKTQTRGKGIYPNEKGGNLLTGKKTNKKFANTVKESQEQGVSEARVKQLPTGAADYSEYDTDFLKAMLKPGILHRDELKFKVLIRRELKKREQQSQQGVAEGSKETKVGIEAYGVRGANSNKWKKTFKSQEAFEKWLDQNEGDVEVSGTREVNLNDMFKESMKEAKLDEEDVIIVPGQGNRHKPGFIPKNKDRTDHEVEMAKSDLFQSNKNAKKIYELIKDIPESVGIEGWVQEKIIKANDYLNTVREYLEHKQLSEDTIEGKRDNFSIDDIKQLEKIKDLETIKARARELIKGFPDRRMKPEKIDYFYNRIDSLFSPMQVIKLMYDLLLAGEGMKTIGSRYSTSANSYQRRFDEMTGGVIAGGGVGEGEENKSSAYQAGFSDGKKGSSDPRASSKYGPGSNDYTAGYRDGLKHEEQSRKDRLEQYRASIAPYVKMSDDKLAQLERDITQRRDEIVAASKKGMSTPAMKQEYKELNDKFQAINQAKFQKRNTQQQGMAEGYRILPNIDREKYQERQGLEGPFRARNGKVYYYDPKAGLAYDPDTDFYIDYDTLTMMDREMSEGVIGKVLAGTALLASLWGIGQQQAQQVYSNSPQLQTLIKYHQMATQQNDQAKIQELERRIENHKTRLSLGKGEVMGSDDKPIVPTYEGLTGNERPRETKKEDDRITAAYRKKHLSAAGKKDDVKKDDIKKESSIMKGIQNEAKKIPDKCPKCDGKLVAESELNEEGNKDACYHKVKSRYKVWPSAYASGALVKCRKVGASNWGNKSK